MEIDTQKLMIRLQPTQEGKWAWNVGYQWGITYESGESDTAENALATACVALRLLNKLNGI